MGRVDKCIDGIKLHNFKSWDKAARGDVVFIEKKKKENQQDVQDKINKTYASFIYTENGFKSKSYQTILLTPTPKLDFAKLLTKKIPDQFGTLTYSSIYTMDIGKDSVVQPGAVIYQNVVIGKNCIIGANTVIGGPGFGFVLDPATKKQIPFPHIGGVLIEDDVIIGSNACIDRGTLGNTIIKTGARIDNLVHIAHNVSIGRNTMVVANCMIAGSVKIGDNTWVGPSTSVLNQKRIGEGAYVGMAACVVKDIPDNKLAYGFPARVKDE